MENLSFKDQMKENASQGSKQAWAYAWAWSDDRDSVREYVTEKKYLQFWIARFPEDKCFFKA